MVGLGVCDLAIDLDEVLPSEPRYCWRLDVVDVKDLYFSSSLLLSRIFFRLLMFLLLLLVWE